jgi:hypothetical protein
VIEDDNGRSPGPAAAGQGKKVGVGGESLSHFSVTEIDK